MYGYGDIKLFAGSASQSLAGEIAEYLSLPLIDYDLIEYANENLRPRLHGSVRGQDVYLIQSLNAPVHRNIMELLLMMDTLNRDSAGRITAVIPYMSYARSDKKDQPRVPIGARLLADMIEVAGADRYMTIDLHAGQIQGFFSIPGAELTSLHLLRDYFVVKLLRITINNGYLIDWGYAQVADRLKMLGLNKLNKFDDGLNSELSNYPRGNWYFNGKIKNYYYSFKLPAYYSYHFPKEFSSIKSEFQIKTLDKVAGKKTTGKRY